MSELEPEIKTIRKTDYLKNYPCVQCSESRRKWCNGIYYEIYDTNVEDKNHNVKHRFVSLDANIYLDFLNLKRTTTDTSYQIRGVKCHSYNRTSCHECKYFFLRLDANPCNNCKNNPINRKLNFKTIYNKIFKKKLQDNYCD